MEARISIITLGVKDLDRSAEFFGDGLGFPTTRQPDDGIVFFKTQGVCLALYPYEELAKDISKDFCVERSKFPGMTIAHNVRTKNEVDEILEIAGKAGGKIEKQAPDVF